jgi:hypothetical protein
MRAVTELQLNTQHHMAYQMDEPDYKLEVRQQPVYARVAIGKEKGTFIRPPLRQMAVVLTNSKQIANQ